jgi:hypothetical protein
VLATEETFIFLNVLLQWRVERKAYHMVERSIVDLFDFKGALVGHSIKVVIVYLERNR